VTIIWTNADTEQPDEDLDPLQYGWTDDNGHYVPDWFSGPAVPDNLFDDVSVTENDDTEDDGQTKDMDDTIDIDDLSSGPEWSDDSDSDN
jgi:hypothetical protein